MKTLLFLVTIIFSLSASAACPDIQDSSLNKDQIIVKNLLISAYKNKEEGINGKNLVEFTEVLKGNFREG